MQSRTQSSFPRLDRPLPRRQLIAQVRAGSTPHIWELYETFKLEDGTLDLLKSILKHLRPELIPDINPGDRLAAEIHPHASAAAASLLLLAKLAVAIIKGFSDVKAAVDLILPSMEGVLQWANFCLDSGVPRIGEVSGRNVAYIIISDVLYMLGSIHQELRRAFLNSRAFIQTFFRIWTAKDHSQGRHSVYWDFRPWRLKDDPIVSIAWILLDTHASDTALVILKELSALDLTLPFASAATQRINQVRNAVADPTFPDGLVKYATKIVPFVLSLVRACAMDDNLNASHQCFEQVHTIGCLTSMLDQLTSALLRRQAIQGNQSPVGRPILELTQPVALLLGQVLLTEPRTIHSICVFLKRGGIPLLVRMIMEVDAHDRGSASGMAASFGKLTLFTTWPAVLKRLHDVGLQTDDSSINRLAAIHHYQPIQTAFRARLSERMRLLKSFSEGDRPILCDNFICPRQRNTRQGSSKQCSRCSSVLYCSQSCQRTDWNQRHRDECSRARQLYLERELSGVEVYDHKSRAFHVKLVEALCEERYMALFQRRVGRLGLAIHDFHPIFECHAGDVNEEIVLFNTHPTPDLWMHKPDAPLVEKYLWPRMNSLGEIYNQRMKNSEMRLAEAIFAHGPKTDIYVYVLMKQVGHGFQAIYSIPRIAASSDQT